jgi:hypothetical protein
MRCRIFLGLLMLIFLWNVPLHADVPKKEAKKPAVELPTGNLDTKDWLKAPTTRLEPGEIDRLVSKGLKDAKLEPAALTSDEQFIRRVYLDLTGKLPLPADIAEFAGDRGPDKRAKLIDKLLDSDDYSKHFAKYWREVFGGARLTDFRARIFQRHFELWLTEQFKTNQKWDKIAGDLLTASGTIRIDDSSKNGQLFFLVSRTGADARTELAAETSRIFLGIQIQCAQCHDHPSDVWKRPQFHEFAAYFARFRQRPVFEEKKIVGAALASLPFGEHRMPDKDDPKKGTTITPKFLDGKAPSKVGKDEERRASLAASIVSKDNPWFAGAFVNRTWGLLLGQSFYTPIDDLGPMKEAVLPDVLVRVAASFRGSDYDIKELLRDIMNSETYQRQVRPGESIDSHLVFSGAKATRMSADDLWNVLTGTLGSLSGGGFGGGKGFGFPGKGGFGGLEGTFKSEFSFDPSTRAEEIEGSVSQALLLMNNPTIQGKISAKGTNLLGRILSSHADDGDAIKTVYLRTLARRPTDRELERCRDHLNAVKDRNEAFEDILWALINSTEYQTRR